VYQAHGHVVYIVYTIAEQKRPYEARNVMKGKPSHLVTPKIRQQAVFMTDSSSRARRLEEALKIVSVDNKHHMFYITPYQEHCKQTMLLILNRSLEDKRFL
jgi:hypothetical protein